MKTRPSVPFALIIDSRPMRAVEEIVEVVPDFPNQVLSHYHSGRLHDWLRVWGYDDFLQDLNAISTTDDEEILVALLKIFGLSEQEQILAVWNEQHSQERRNIVRSIIQDYWQVSPVKIQEMLASKGFDRWSQGKLDATIASLESAVTTLMPLAEISSRAIAGTSLGNFLRKFASAVMGLRGDCLNELKAVLEAHRAIPSEPVGTEFEHVFLRPLCEVTNEEIDAVRSNIALYGSPDKEWFEFWLALLAFQTKAYPRT